MKPILAPVDFSETSLNAARYAAELCRINRAPLILFHAYHTPPLAIEIPVQDVTPEEVKAEAAGKLEKLRKDLLAKVDKNLTIFCIWRSGFAADEIETYAGSKMSAIVMGMQGSSFIDEHITGSITTAVIRNAKQPVWVIKRKLRFRPLNKIVVAIDYLTPPSAAALKKIKELSGLHHAELCILHVREKHNVLTKTQQLLVERKVRKYLPAAGFFTEDIRDADITETIRYFCSAQKADLLIMLPHRRSFLEKIFFEPSSKRMAFRTALPLLTIRH
jgi:nucleotide-binding universal stress UspA family protein